MQIDALIPVICIMQLDSALRLRCGMHNYCTAGCLLRAESTGTGDWSEVSTLVTTATAATLITYEIFWMSVCACAHSYMQETAQEIETVVLFLLVSSLCRRLCLYVAAYWLEAEKQALKLWSQLCVQCRHTENFLFVYI